MFTVGPVGHPGSTGDLNPAVKPYICAMATRRRNVFNRHRHARLFPEILFPITYKIFVMHANVFTFDMTQTCTELVIVLFVFILRIVLSVSLGSIRDGKVLHACIAIEPSQ